MSRIRKPQLPRHSLRVAQRSYPWLTLAAALLLVVSSPVAPVSAEDDPLEERLLEPETVEPLDAGSFARVLEHHRGQVVVVNLWATWCIPCVQELPELNELQKRYADRGLQVLAVSVDSIEDLDSLVRPFFAKRAPDLVSYIHTEKDTFAFVEPLDAEWLGALPTSFFIDRQGKIQKSAEGRLKYQTFEKIVLELLAEDGAANNAQD